MKRSGVALGVLGLGVAGALAGGIGVAAAATGQAGAVATGPFARTAATAYLADNDASPGNGVCGRAGQAGQAGQGTTLDAAAKYLGLTEDQLRTRLQDGQSMAQVATAQGKTVSGLEDAIVSAMTQRLQANTALTSAQRATLLERLRERVQAFVSTVHEPGTGMGLRLGRADDASGTGAGFGMGGGFGMGPHNGMGAGMGR